MAEDNLGVLKFADCVLSVSARELRRPGKSGDLEQRHLEPLDMELLCYLVTQKQNVAVSKADLEQDVWHAGPAGIEDWSIESAVHKVRVAIGDNPPGRLIKTIRKNRAFPQTRYCFIADVEGGAVEPTTPVPTPGSTVRSSPPTHGSAAADLGYLQMAGSLGKFPNHIPAITALVDNPSNREIVIHCDSVDYGSFRNFQAHRALVDALKKQGREGKTVQLLIWPRHEKMSWANRFREQAARPVAEFADCIHQFLAGLRSKNLFTDTEEYQLLVATDEEFGRLKKQSEETGDDSALAQWLTRWEEPDGDVKSLFALLEKYVGSVKHELIGARVIPDDHVRIPAKYDDILPPHFLWMVDGKKGIIVVPKLGADAPAFRVEDEEFLTALEENFRSIYRQPPKD